MLKVISTKKKGTRRGENMKIKNLENNTILYMIFGFAILIAGLIGTFFMEIPDKYALYADGSAEHIPIIFALLGAILVITVFLKDKHISTSITKKFK